MSSCRILAPCAVLALIPILESQACGPFFPVSYFPGGNDYYSRQFQTTTVSTNAAQTCYDVYRVKPHLGAELAMIGAHYYPAWTGKAPRSNRVSTARADELDFFAAGAAAGVSKEAVAEDWKRFTAFNDGVCKRLEGGEDVALPKDVPGYALEFYLYKLGHAQWLVFRKDEDPAPFGTLLSLPKERRLHRTVWVHFVRIANARTFGEKDRHLDAMRRALDDGFKDTAALESFALRFLSTTGGNRYDPLVLTAYAGVPWTEWPGFAKRIFCGNRPSEPEPKWIAEMCTDIVGVEVAIAYGAGGRLPAGAVRPENPALGADRQAWIAFTLGDLDLCRRLLAMAPESSLVRLFLEARLARLDGNYEKAGEWLHKWLDEYRRKGATADAAMTGYGVRTECEEYWYSGASGKFWDNFAGPIHYTGAFGPSGSFREPVYGDSKDLAAAQSEEPTLPRIVSGELGVVMVASRDLEEALHAFLLARNWVDVAFVAERCMTVDELVKFMRGSRIAPRDRDPLRGLLMRRLMRCGRTQEAAEWAPPNLKPLVDEFRALTSASNDAGADDDARAVAFLNLSRLVLSRGMELMGTELRPDVSVFDGNYADDAIPISEPSELPARLRKDGAPSRWAGWEVPQDRVTSRFHYRRKAIEYARASVELAKDEDVRAWCLMFGGVATLSLLDTQEADKFYKQLAVMRHPQAKVGKWFDELAYKWFREEFYNKERHLVPLRVPPRFTKEQLKQLKAPEPPPND